MMVTSLSFTYTQVSAPAATSATRQRAPEAQAQPVARDEGRRASDMPQRSPMYRALKEALAAMAQTTTGAGASSSASQASEASATRTETPAVDAAAASGAAGEATALSLDDALANFAQALMQALRDQFGSRRERDSEHGDGHHHHHHHHGRRGWGDAAQRVDALAQQVGATASQTVDGTTAAAAAGVTTSHTVAVAADAPTSTATPAAASQPSTEPVQPNAAATATAEPSSAARITINVTLNLVQGQDSTASKSPFQGLIDAFARLQKALGQPDDDADALPQRLSAFLQALADQLRGEDAASTDVATQPGTLISVTA